MIYYPWGLQSAAIRFKNSLQENSKIHAITEDVIEACHNDIVALIPMIFVHVFGPAIRHNNPKFGNGIGSAFQLNFWALGAEMKTFRVFEGVPISF